MYELGELAHCDDAPGAARCERIIRPMNPPTVDSEGRPHDPADDWKHRKFTSLNAYGFSKNRLKLWFETAFQNAFRDAMIARIDRLTRTPQPFTRALDIACGVGDWTIKYLSLAREVVGLDVNPDFLQHARELTDSLTPLERERIQFVEADIRTFSDYRGADLVCLGGCAMFFPDELLNDLFAAIVETMPARGVVYLRSSVRAEGLPQVERRTSDGPMFFRPHQAYMDLAERRGLRLLEATFSPIVLSEARFGPALGHFIGERMHRRYDATRQLDYCNYLFVRG